MSHISRSCFYTSAPVTRLVLTGMPLPFRSTALTDEELKRMGEIEDEIARTEGGEGVEGSAFELGVAGQVDEAVAALNRVESLRREFQSLEQKALNAARETSGRKSMLVCDVSGNFMNATDNGDRLRCHFEGKQVRLRNIETGDHDSLASTRLAGDFVALAAVPRLEAHPGETQGAPKQAPHAAGWEAHDFIRW